MKGMPVEVTFCKCVFMVLMVHAMKPFDRGECRDDVMCCTS